MKKLANLIIKVLSLPFLGLALLLGVVAPELFCEVGNWAARRLGLQANSPDIGNFKGKEAIVISDDREKLMVELGGTIWKAIPEEPESSFGEGTLVTVIGTKGLALIISKKDNNTL